MAKSGKHPVIGEPLELLEISIFVKTPAVWQLMHRQFICSGNPDVYRSCYRIVAHFVLVP